MAITVLIDGDDIEVSGKNFDRLLGNSVASTYKGYEQAMDTGRITLSELIVLCRRAEVPYVLLFAAEEVVAQQVKMKEDKLLSGVTKESFSVNSRGYVELKGIELIVKDLLRKQELLKRGDPSLQKNLLVGSLRQPGPTVKADALKLKQILGFDGDKFMAQRKKGDALDFLIESLESRQVLVSQSVNNYMPQRVQSGSFSGITIRDKKIPYIFLSRGDQGDYQEPVGRQIFTLTLLAVLVARGVFSAVQYDGSTLEGEVAREFDIAGEFLMPEQNIRSAWVSSLDDLKGVANEFKVTPSAVVTRGSRLGLCSYAQARSWLDDLAEEYSSREKPQMRSPRAENAIRRYNGREMTSRMLDLHDRGVMTAGEFCRVVGLNKIKPSQIESLREAI